MGNFPNTNVEVLFFANGCVIPGYYVGSNGSHHVWKSSREGYIFLDDEVTHWMPLPKSPKENEQCWNACIPMIEAAPAVDVAHGWWEFRGNDDIVCSVCGARYFKRRLMYAYYTGPNSDQMKGFRYCPHCGVKMEETANNE